MTCCHDKSLLLTTFRAIEDYAILLFGSAAYKITRLLFVALLCVHLFACAFFRVKKESAISPEDVDSFYESKNVSPAVSTNLFLQIYIFYPADLLFASALFAGPCKLLCNLVAFVISIQ